MTTAAEVGIDTGHDTLVIDPVKMNITNRVAEGTILAGKHRFEGGLLLQGTLDGSGEIAGRLVVWHSGQLRGRFRVLGDLYVLGQVGATTDNTDPDTLVECQGTAYVASTGISTGTILATRLRMYDGATLQGPFKTLRSDESLPVLDGRL
ncbi:MAG: polymer-forming cytoskeletal protein [Vitreoscilla sp.]|nr:polymer-forming cytoskeletal protein [Vitreoscilla sp.]MBP6675620.1 polymer-forming cytoskeletal protein [Vitreoscilla sp.]